MVRRKRIIVWLAVLCAVFLTAGCGRKEGAGSKASVSPEQETEAPAMLKEKIETQETETIETVSSEAGPEEEKKDIQEKIEAFAERLQEAVADRDLESFGDMVLYPLTVIMADGESLVITDQKELQKQNPDLIFGDDFMIAVANVDTTTLIMTKDGVVMGEDGPGLVFKETGTETFGIVTIQE